jgi:hypothetical protein
LREFLQTLDSMTSPHQAKAANTSSIAIS